MSQKVPSKTQSEHLRRLHAFTQNAEEKLRLALQQTEDMGAEAEDVGKAPDLATWIDSYADLLITIRLVVLGNEELQKIFEVSIANKVANAITLAENWELLQRVDASLIACSITQVQDQETMNDAITLAEKWGGEGAQRLGWLVKALKKNGY